MGEHTVVDQYTYGLIKQMVQQNINSAAFTLVKLNGVRDISIAEGQLTIDTSNIEILPTKFETQIISIPNCHSVPKRYANDIKITTLRTISFQFSHTIPTSAVQNRGTYRKRTVVRQLERRHGTND
jgi:hypothetical protein